MTALRLDAEASWRLTAELLSNEVDSAHRTLTEIGVPRHDENGDEMNLTERLRWSFLHYEKEKTMSKWTVDACATVSLRFEVDAEDVDAADEKATEMAKKIKVAIGGGLVVPSGVTVGWPAVDMFAWEAPVEEP